MDDNGNIHSLLKDPTRRKIIVMLGEQERVGFKEFRDTLKIGVGTLYYHLDILSDYISQDKNRKYMLSEKGKLLYKALTEGSIPTSLKLDKTYQSGRLRWIFLAPVFSMITNPIRWLPVSALILFFGAIGVSLSGLETLLLFYTPTIHSFELEAAFFILSWISVFFFTDILAHLLFKRSGDDLHLFTCMTLAAIPLAAYPYIYIVLSSIIPATIVTLLLRILLLILQVWTLILVTSALSYGKGLRLERSIIISLSLLYLNIALLIILGNLSLTT